MYARAKIQLVSLDPFYQSLSYPVPDTKPVNMLTPKLWYWTRHLKSRKRLVLVIEQVQGAIHGSPVQYFVLAALFFDERSQGSIDKGMVELDQLTMRRLKGRDLSPNPQHMNMSKRNLFSNYATSVARMGS
uniref:Uncharacterized protein n=1 Tax=Utricularia reniformis TaxID=192314 RepID=A0A1Y0B2T7_9LAMI|nr:hypothetical protein AEK19_MT1517 [Utricularia reniformis]ART31707.1 hypothetical protein AEK19_MT1517 [Utricularia reniformis]